MKQLFETIMWKILAVVFAAFIGIWLILMGLIGTVFAACSALFVGVNKDADKFINKITDKLLEVLIWPYRVMGIANSWDDYVQWVSKL